MRELELLEAICRGIDPCDGSVLDTPRDPDLDKARLSYLAKLKRMKKRVSVAANPRPKADSCKPPMHGKAWSASHDAALLAKWRAAEAPTAEEIGKDLGRGTEAILARLAHLGEYEDRESARSASAARTHRAGGG